jgi:hypothetical protein
MAILQTLSCLALRGVVQGVGQGLKGGVAVLGERFTDHSDMLLRALQTANKRAWRALEIALAGGSWWEACKVRLAPADEQAFREPLRAFLADCPWDKGVERGPDFRRTCLQDLRAARKAGLLLQVALGMEKLAEGAGQFARFTDPAAIIDAEVQAVDRMGDELRQAGYPALAELALWHPPDGPPVLAAAVRYFFRREVEKDQQLFQGLAHPQLQELTASQQAGLAALGDALDRHGTRLEALLDDVRSAVRDVHDDVLDVKAELARQGAQLQELGAAVLAALQQHHLEHRPLRSDDSLSIHDEGERRLVRELVARYRALPPDERRQLPALLNAVGKLEVVAGEFESAQRDFQEVGALVEGPTARAEALHNAYRAALERRAWPEALVALLQAARLDPEHLEPFPLRKFEPERILDAGGFGVAFVCRNRHSGARVVIKTFTGDRLGRDVSEVFQEAHALEEVEHPAIIRVRDCDYADMARTRPFLVMDYFDGQTLAEQVAWEGTLSPEDLLPLARLIAEGLRAAHMRGILHRDVKPANLLVRRSASWEVKLIDFGLALAVQTVADTAHLRSQKTIAGSSIAGTLDYAAPEQIGRRPGVGVGTWSDVYGFGKTCCFALFGTPQPTFQHWQKLPTPLADLLGRCIAEAPEERPATFDAVLAELAPLGPAVPAPPFVEPIPTPPPSPREEHAAPKVPAGQSSRAGSAVILGLVVLFGALIVLFLLPGLSGPHTAGVAGISPKKPGALPGGISAAELPHLADEMAGRPPEERIEWARQLAQTAPLKGQDAEIARVAHVLDPMLNSDDRPVRLAAAQALGNWGTRENVPNPIRRLREDESEVRAAVIVALARIRDPGAIAPIAQRLADHSDQVRGSAVAALQGFGPEAEPAVLTYLSSQSTPVKEGVCEVLAAIGTKASIEPLTRAMEAPNPVIGPRAKAALETIRARLDKDRAE